MFIKGIHVVLVVEPTWQCRRHKRFRFDPWVGKTPWRRKWQPTPLSLPGEFHGQCSLVGYSPWGRKDSDTTEATVSSFSFDQSRNKWKEIMRFSPDDPAPKSWICTQAYLTPSECSFYWPGVLHWISNSVEKSHVPSYNSLLQKWQQLISQLSNPLNCKFCRSSWPTHQFTFSCMVTPGW